ncbi:unnamed protein product [Arctia plantaginis]|uniref:Uncharacterized protein n=1 Tax=Arctia plantaginis TaxID=874455 RepID=A0A8S0ZPQ9_ARCPL|nr:unnamed protein product [Arctia plantaginis]
MWVKLETRTSDEIARLLPYPLRCGKMPLTGAEKTRRYREKLKLSRPEEYKAQCNRNLQRMNTKKKKISEMTAKDAEDQRKKWRDDKRRSIQKKKERKNEQKETENVNDFPTNPSNDATITTLRKKIKLLFKKCRNLTTQVQIVKTQKETLKKRFQRLKQRTTKRISDLEEDILKMKAREEVLAYTLKRTYRNIRTRKEKKTLRNLIENAKNKKHVWEMMGLKGRGRKENNEIKVVEIKELTKFYLRDDNSRNTSETEVVLVCDFSENYETKMGSEIQAMHFGASKTQITLHTGMIYWTNRSQSFCTIAESNNHQPPAIWAHLEPLLNLIREESPNVTRLHFFSDGPSSQYRQKNNFYLFAHFTNRFGFDATWSFFEAGHGKSVADGIGGCVKRTLDRKVCQGRDIVDAQDAYDILNQCLKRIQVFLIPDHSINEITRILPPNVQPLKGTLRVHQIIAIDKSSVKFRDVSCFCGPVSGHCNCFSPQIHNVVPLNVKIKQLPRKIKSRNASNSFLAVNVPSTSKVQPPMSSYAFEMPNEDEEVSRLTSEDLSELVEFPQQMESFTILDTDGILKTNIKNSKFLECHKCTFTILGKKVKCLACSKWYCEECVEGSPMELDYICNKCLIGEGSYLIYYLVLRT